jgi:predicted nucleotidyltransferase
MLSLRDGPDPIGDPMKQLAHAFRDPLPRYALAAHRAELRVIALASGAREVMLFGSARHGTDRPGSDLDLLLIDPPSNLSGFQLVAIEQRLARLAGVPVQLLTLNDLPPDKRERILREAVAL